MMRRVAQLEAQAKAKQERTEGRRANPFWTQPGHFPISVYIPQALDDRKPVWPSFIPPGWPEYMECPRCGLEKGCRISYWAPYQFVQWNVSKISDQAHFPLPVDVIANVRDRLEAAGLGLSDILEQGERTLDALEVVWRQLLVCYSPLAACEFVRRDGDLKLAPLDVEQFRVFWQTRDCEPAERMNHPTIA